MRIGTPGFVGARLVEAREARGLTAIALADALGVTRSAVSQWESEGDGSPSPENMKAITERLRLPHRFFLEKPRGRPHGAIFHRSKKSTTKAARDRAQARYEWLLDLVAYLRNYVKFPAVDFPDFTPPADPAAISDEMICRYAADTRRHWGLGPGPISNVALLLEKKGAVIARYALHADELDAFSEWGWHDSTPYVVLNSEKNSAARSRFDVAHELGHLIMHRNVPKTIPNTGDYFKLIEDQAHLFAGEFLLPRESFGREFYAASLDSFAALQPKWKVSIAFIMQRFYKLGKFSDEQRVALYRNLNRRGWRTHEPYDDVLEAEVPRLLKQSIELILDRAKVVDVHQFLHDVIYPAQDIEYLTSLPAGFLDRIANPVALLRSQADGTGVSDVIRFDPRNTKAK